MFVNKKYFKLIISGVVLTPGTIAPIILSSCSCFGVDISDQDITKHLQIYNFLNDRTFSIGAFWNYENRPSSTFGYVVGTTWLFYHAPNSKFENNYTYYALTNLHVAGAIDYYINNTQGKQQLKISDAYVCLSYQTIDEIQNSRTLIDFSQFNKNKEQCGPSKTFAIDHVNYSKTPTTSNYSPLFAQYSTIDGIDNSIARRYFDAEVIKLNLDTIANKDQTLKSRLDRLNVYANQNNNYVLKFQEPNKIDNVKNVYSLGYPMCKSNFNKVYIHDQTHLSAQVISFSNMDNKTMSNFENYDKDKKTQDCLTPTKYGGDNINWTTYDNAIYLAGTNLSSYDYIYGSKDWGSGASGSCGLYVENENDESTYKVMGIFWGMRYNSSSAWIPMYQSFAYNWGTENNLINNFMYFMENEYSDTNPTNDQFVGITPKP